MSSEQPDYLSYLLRLWREKRRGQAAWRASLQETLAGEPVTFATMEDLVAFLRRQTGALWDADRDESGRE